MNEVQRIAPHRLSNSLAPSQTDGLALTLAKNGSEEVSVFAGPPASAAHIAASMHKLSVCFPDMTKEFFSILTERISKTAMSDARLDYAVNRVLDTFTYKQLTIADVLSIDVKCRVMSYAEMCNDAAKRGASTDDYAPLRIGDADKPVWVLKVDKIRYRLPDAL